MSLRFSRLAALILAAATSSLWAAPVVVNGRINNIDGDHDGAVDDLKISRIRFNVTAGTSMKVVPHVIREGDKSRIRLLVNIEDGKISEEQQVDQIPVVEKATLATQALIWEGESLLIGGLTRNANSKSGVKVPWLGDLPLIGYLFKSTASSTSQKERMFMITPRLVPANHLTAGQPNG